MVYAAFFLLYGPPFLGASTGSEATMSAIFQSFEVTPAAIAGVHRIVEWILTKL